jgi:hypothetical protein
VLDAWGRPTLSSTIVGVLPVLLCTLTLFAFQSIDCPDVASCRQAALDAMSRGEFETFHDLAWRAAQKGKPNDPELMALVARAQSLSGRAGDALVMLRRLAQKGIATDAATSDDFRRVRALAGWPEVEALLKANEGPTPTPDAPAASPATVTPPMVTPAAPSSSSSVAPPAGKPTAAPAPAARTAPAVVATPEDEALPSALSAIHPAGLAHDEVSRRFILGDRRENKLVIFDEVFKRATDMVGADSAGFFGLSALEIDHRRGDLWVANSSSGRAASLHKLQLVSGRVLFALEVPEEMGATMFVDAAVLSDGHVLLLDAQGRRLLGVLPGKREFHRAGKVDVDGLTSLAPLGPNTVYVAHRDGVLRVDLASRSASAVRGAPAGLLRIRPHRGALIAVQPTDEGHRILRLRLDGAARKVNGVDVLDASVTMPDASGITIVDDVVSYIASVDGAAVMRRVKGGR